MPEDAGEGYETEELGGVTVLKHKANGDCVYLGESGCTIHGRAPVMCRVYDCREQYRRYSRGERRELMRRRVLDPEVVRQAAKLIREFA
jgi:Fe-S-cluster containining protein